MTSVDVRAFRGSRRSSVYRNQTLTGQDFRRILDVARSLELPVLGSLGSGRPERLNKDKASRVTEEATQLRLSGQLLELDDELATIASLGRWCRHRGTTWMTFHGGMALVRLDAIGSTSLD